MSNPTPPEDFPPTDLPVTPDGQPPEPPESDEEAGDGSQDQDIDPGPAEAPTEPAGQKLDCGVAVPPGRILLPGQPLEFDGEPDVSGFVVAAEDVYRRVTPRRSSRPTFIQIVHKGARVPVRNVVRVRTDSKL